MTTHHRCLSALFALALASSVAPAYAQTGTADDPVDAARDHFKRGVALFHEGNFRAALIEFRRANETAPNYRIQYNLGQTYFELHDYAGALRAFETYLEKGGNEIRAKRRAEVEQEIEKLRTRVGYISIKTNVPGAEVLIDDTVVGTSPLDEAVLVSAGRRKVSAVKGPGIPTVRFVELAGGDQMSIELQLATRDNENDPMPAPAPARAPAPGPAADAGTSAGMGTGFWVSLAATGVFATGATVSGIMAANARSDYDDELDTYPTTASDVQDAADKTDRMALMTDIFAGAAVTAGVVTVIFAASGSDGADGAARREPGVRVGIGPGSVALDGRF